MLAFATTCEAIAATPSKLAKIERVAHYLRSLPEPDLAAAARYFTGNPFAQREERTLAIGGRTLVAAAQAAWGVSDDALAGAYRETGDIGAALGRLMRPGGGDLGLFAQAPLTPAGLKTLLDEVAAASGKAAQKRRVYLCTQILAATRDSLEATYVIKIMTGELRIGLREGLILDAIASAFDAPQPDVRRAAMAAGDIGVVAVAARTGTLADLKIAYGTPIAFMLASPMQYGAPYREIAQGNWIIEDKFDGIRAQVHKHGATIRIYSRTLNDVARSYPEVAEALRTSPHDFILDGEIVAVREGRVLPFRYLQTRLQRKDVSADLMAAVPVCFFAFDALALDDRFLLDEPLAMRRSLIAEAVVAGPALAIAPWTTLETGASPEVVHEHFEAARGLGNEGLMLKLSDSTYVPGKRGKAWLKLKRELETLDVVVVRVEWGHGKRVKVLSDYTFAVRGRNGELLTIGKAYSGLTDVEIAELTPWFLDHTIGKLNKYQLEVEPKIVLEVAFDVIQKSDLHASGYSLRFPRIVRIREDKRPEEIDTIEEVERIYSAMIAREGVEH